MALSLEWLAREDFGVFVEKSFEILNPGTRFKRGWHIDAMVHALTEMAEGKARRQIITLPPRSLKSHIFSICWPAFLLGHNPAERIVVVSYSETLAEQLSNDTRRLMNSEFYKRTFPATRLVREPRMLLETDAGGQRLGVSVAGGITGLGGAWIIIDDPHNAADVGSAVVREQAKRYLDETLSTRLNDPATGRIILVMQRLHEADLAGHILAGGGEWRHLKLQAKATQDMAVEIGPGLVRQVRAGDLLHPERLPQSTLDELRLRMGALAFEAQYQQEPLPAQGAMVKPEWLRYYDALPDLSYGTIVLSVDTALKKDAQHDYSVCTVWLKTETEHYLIDLWRDKVNYHALKERIRLLRARYRAAHVLIEDQGAGTILIQELGSLGIPCTPCRSHLSKEVRLGAASSYIESGLMLLPRSAPWRPAFEAELLGFPGTEHDDQVDSLSWSLGPVRPSC